MAPGAFDTTWGVVAICLSVPVSLAFGTLGDGSFGSWRFKCNFGIEEGRYEVNVLVVFFRLEIDKKEGERDISSSLFDVEYVRNDVPMTFNCGP